MAKPNLSIGFGSGCGGSEIFGVVKLFFKILGWFTLDDEQSFGCAVAVRVGRVGANAF